MDRPLIIPPALRPGARIAICSPAGIARRENVEAAMEVLRRNGYRPELTPHAFGVSGSFSGTIDERFADLRDAILNPEIEAIICSRGGYGAIHLLDRLDRLPLRDNAKWLVGFSDISALHALMHRHGIASIHGPMAKHISASGGSNPDFRALNAIFCGAPAVEYTVDPHPLNRPGIACAPLQGGNLAVLQALVATPYDLLRPDTILFIEDIGEPIYKVERMLMQLRMSGVLPRLAGLIVGEFTGAESDRNHPSVESMIRQMVDPYDYPVTFNFPIGHGSCARPLIESLPTRLTVTPSEVRVECRVECRD